MLYSDKSVSRLSSNINSSRRPLIRKYHASGGGDGNSKDMTQEMGERAKLDCVVAASMEEIRVDIRRRQSQEHGDAGTRQDVFENGCTCYPRKSFTYIQMAAEESRKVDNRIFFMRRKKLESVTIISACPSLTYSFKT